MAVLLLDLLGKTGESSVNIHENVCVCVVSSALTYVRTMRTYYSVVLLATLTNV